MDEYFFNVENLTCLPWSVSWFRRDQIRLIWKKWKTVQSSIHLTNCPNHHFFISTSICIDFLRHKNENNYHKHQIPTFCAKDINLMTDKFVVNSFFSWKGRQLLLIRTVKKFHSNEMVLWFQIQNLNIWTFSNNLNMPI